jgi:O-antigen ligase
MMCLNRKENIKNNMGIYLGLVSAAIIIFTTISRGPFVSVALALLCGLWFINRRAAIFAFSAAAGIPLIAILTSSVFYEKFYRLIHLQDVSVIWRLKVWAVNFELFKEHPLLGVGFGNSSYYLEEYYKKLGWEDLHFYGANGNNYTEILSGMGILGFASFYFVAFLFLKYSYDLYKNSRDSKIYILAYGLFTAQIYYHLSGFIEGLFFSVQTRYIIVAFWIMTLALKINIDNKKA